MSFLSVLSIIMSYVFLYLLAEVGFRLKFLGFTQCCGSGMFIPDPGPEFFHPGSQILGQNNSGSRIRIRIKEFKYIEPKNMFLTSRKYDPGCRIQILIFFLSRIQESKRHRLLDPGSGYATPVLRYRYRHYIKIIFASIQD